MVQRRGVPRVEAPDLVEVELRDAAALLGHLSGGNGLSLLTNCLCLCHNSDVLMARLCFRLCLHWLFVVQQVSFGSPVVAARAVEGLAVEQTCRQLAHLFVN